MASFTLDLSNLIPPKYRRPSLFGGIGAASLQMYSQSKNDRETKRAENRKLLFSYNSPETFYREGRKLGCSKAELKQDLKGWGHKKHGINYSQPDSYEIIEVQRGKFITGNKETSIAIKKVPKAKRGKAVSQISSAPDLYQNHLQPVSLQAENGFTFFSFDENVENSTESVDLDYFLQGNTQRGQFLEQTDGVAFSYPNTFEDLSNTDGGLALNAALWAALFCWFWKSLAEWFQKPFAIRGVVRDYTKGAITFKQASTLLNSTLGIPWIEAFELLEPTGKPMPTRPGTGNTIISSFATFLGSSAGTGLRNIVCLFALAYFSFCFFLDFGLFGIGLELFSAFLVHRWWKHCGSEGIKQE